MVEDRREIKENETRKKEGYRKGGEEETREIWRNIERNKLKEEDNENRKEKKKKEKMKMEEK